MYGQHLDFTSMFHGRPIHVTATLEKVGKARAEDLLRKQLSFQRTLGKPLLERLKQSLRNGEYIDAIINPIFISENGKTMDAQHRLTAVAETGIAANFLIVRGLPEESFVYFDQNRTRNARDTLKVSGISNPAAVATAAKLIHELIEESNAVPRSEVLHRLVEDYPLLPDAVSKGDSMKQDTHGLPGVLSVMYFLYCTKYGETGKKFFDMLRNGSDEFNDPRWVRGGSVHSSQHPVSKLKRKLLSEWKNNSHTFGRYSRSNEAIDPRDDSLDVRYKQMCYIHLAFEAFLHNRRSLTWRANQEIISRVITLTRELVSLRHSFAPMAEEVTVEEDTRDDLPW